MELRQIEFFLQLYKDRNITVASQNLYISQQGMSKSIANLEKEVGFPLFKRSLSGVKPTANHAGSYKNNTDTTYNIEHQSFLNFFAQYAIPIPQEERIIRLRIHFFWLFNIRVWYSISFNCFFFFCAAIFYTPFLLQC